MSIVFIFWVTITACVDASCMFEKYYQQKLAVDSTATYTAKGVLDCEKLCLELTDSCLAVNVIYTDGHYICDVIEGTTSLLERPRLSNPKGKLIIKRGKHVKYWQIVQGRRAAK